MLSAVIKVDFLKNIYRKARSFFETSVSDTFLNECIWKFRDIYKGKKWIKEYYNTINHPHRKQIVSAISSFGNINSVLEIGCNSGPNMFLLAQKIKNLQIYGIDINKRAIAYGKKMAHLERINNLYFFYGKAYDLSIFSSNTIDIVLCDAVLMFVGPKKIGQALSEMRRVTRRGLVFNEYHSENPPEGNYLDGRWIYNYKELLDKYFPHAKISFERSAFSGGEWDIYGTLIIVRFS